MLARGWQRFSHLILLASVLVFAVGIAFAYTRFDRQWTPAQETNIAPPPALILPGNVSPPRLPTPAPEIAPYPPPDAIAPVHVPLTPTPETR